jgi:putative tributyrin esterase
MGHLILNFPSRSLRQTTQVQIILPEESNDVTPLYKMDDIILIYLLHGLTGNASEWTRFSKIEYYAKKYNAIVVMPEVHRSFYINQLSANYEQYISEELPSYLGDWFKLPSRHKTFLTGESMGGYGTLRIGLKYPNNYEKIAAMSPVISLRKVIETEPDLFEKNEWSHMELLTLQEPLDLIRIGAVHPNILLLCGMEDEFYDDTKDFEKICTNNNLNISSYYETGDHSWLYWDNSIHHAIRYFRDLHYSDDILTGL